MRRYWNCMIFWTGGTAVLWIIVAAWRMLTLYPPDFALMLSARPLLRDGRRPCPRTAACPGSAGSDRMKVFPYAECRHHVPCGRSPPRSSPVRCWPGAAFSEEGRDQYERGQGEQPGADSNT